MNEATNVRRIARIGEGAAIYFHLYEALKPRVFGSPGEWEERGRRYNIKGIDSLLKGNTSSFEIDAEVQEDLEKYREMIRERKEQYLRDKA